MNYIVELSNKVSSFTGISKENIKYIIYTILSVLIIQILKIVIKQIYSKIQIDDRKRFVQNRKMQISLTIINIVAVIIIWSSKLAGLVTIISVISAAFTIALRDIIFNFFCGLYIRVSKVFALEDRIEVNGLKGDVVNLKALCFEVLEIGDRVNGEQSTGRIVNIPNSVVFSHPFKNYNKAFKYIWDEVKVEVTLDSNVEEVKELLYSIVNDNDIVKDIPQKMENEVIDSSLEYRIYFNKLEPIIYTEIAENHINLYVRYLVHPKKERIVRDEINTKILEDHRNGKICLYKD